MHLARRTSLELAKFNSPGKITNRNEPTETNRTTNLNLTMSKNEDEVDPNAQISNRSRTQMEPAGDIIDISMSYMNANTLTGNHFTGSRSDASSIRSSVGSTVKANLEEQKMTSLQMESFADIIAQSFADAMKKEREDLKTEYASDSSKMPPLGVTGVTLSSGLDVLHVPRSGTQQATAGINSKYNRGDSESSRLKRKKTVTVALSDKLACNNVLGIITADDLGKHDLAADCLSNGKLASKASRRYCMRMTCSHLSKYQQSLILMILL